MFLLKSPKIGRWTLRQALLTVAAVAVLCRYTLYLRALDDAESNAAATVRQLGGGAEWETHHSLPFLPRQRSCFRVTFCGRLPKSETDFRFLLGMPSVRSLYLSGIPVTDEQMKMIGRCRLLEFLNIGKAQITDVGLRELRNCRKLRDLHCGNTMIRGRGFNELAGTVPLEKLWTDGSPIDDDGMASIAALPQLRVFEAFSSSITGVGLKHIAKCRSLEDVFIGGSFSRSDAQCLLDGPRFTHIDLVGDGFREPAYGSFRKLDSVKALP